MTEAFVVVDGVATHEDDINDKVPGTYEIEIDKDAPEELYEEIALEVFHCHVAIAMLDEFEISVVDENGEPFTNQSEEPNLREKVDLLSMGNFLGRRRDSDIPFNIGPKVAS
ncbi:hypothetical protein [Roseibium sp. RKSG952]|uniref:hypothetical protein n=1 Tax=Roseibium sp. RKSG952 TaxID=2529384 RepID=UPI0012BB8917|nr:hypothetical protein [Roseibium sp. RKSG952]MTH94733.1 hypothetical protein [Roseibium sp. RKSG952]